MVAQFKASLDQKAAWMRDRHAAVSPSLPATSTAPSFAERHYAIAEIAELWSLSCDVVRKLFEREPGVLVLGGQNAPHKRRYTTLRIPETVVRRVHRRMTNI
jgi:hypothetical protein